MPFGLHFVLSQEDPCLDVVPPRALSEIGRSDVGTEAAPPDYLGMELANEFAGVTARPSGEERL
ncbi:hypothetical protein D3C87_2048540 [compost metagenome]